MPSPPEHVPQAVSPPPGNPRFPLFDGLRAIAALSVVANHVAETPQGIARGWIGSVATQLNSGVTIFFVISGFLLYRPFVRARYHGLATPSIARYARRRVLRIVPAYWLALTVAALWFGIAGPFGPNWWVYYGFLQTYNPSTAFAGLPVAWSLSTEMTFYVILPMYAICISRVAAGQRRYSREVGILGLLALFAIGFGHVIPHHASYKYTYTIAGTFDWFALGMFLAVSSVALELTERPVQLVQTVRRLPEAVWAVAAFAFGLQVLLTRYGHATSLSTHLLFGATAFFLVLPAVFEPRREARSVPRRILGSRLLMWLGLVSYGIYLWHVPLIRKIQPHIAADPTRARPLLLTLVVGSIAATAVAAASYYLVERWFLQLKEPRHRTRVASTAPAP